MTDINYIPESVYDWVLVDNKFMYEQKEIRDARLNVPCICVPNEPSPILDEGKLSYDTIISRNNLIIGGAGTGKTTLITRMLKKLEDIRDIIVLAPDYMHNVYKSVVPHAILKSELTKKELLEIANQHKEKQKKYNTINDNKLIKNLAEKAHKLSNYRQIVDNNELAGYTDFIQNRLTVIANREELCLLDLSIEEKYILNNIFFDRKFVFVIDEFQFFHKILLECMNDQTTYWVIDALFSSCRYSGITAIISHTDNSLLFPVMKNSADTIIFTNRHAAINYMSKHSYEYNQEKRDEMNILCSILKKNYYKFVIYHSNNNDVGFMEPFAL